jgi:hypothetical protein
MALISGSVPAGLATGLATASTADAAGQSRVARFTTDRVSWDWQCGYPLTVHGDEKHVYSVRTTRDGVDLFSDAYQVIEVQTNPQGQSFVLESRGVFKDLRGTRVSDTLTEYVDVQNGQPFVFTDMAGRVVSRDRGGIRFSFTYDSSTGEFGPGSVDFRANGPHPALGVDFCAIVAPMVGSDSRSHHTPRPLGTTDAAMGYYEYLPPSYHSSGAKSPLLVVTNGYGENGDGSAAALDNLLGTGIPRYLNIGGWPTDRPFVVLSTQQVEDPPGFDFSACDFPGATWVGSCAMQQQHDQNHAQPAPCTTPDEIHDFITYSVSHYNVDPSRVYLTGLSCGAFGAWEYLATYGAAQVAAAVPISGDGRPAWASAGCGLGAVPIWSFHGALDDTVNPAGSIEPMTSLAACPGVTSDRARLTVYPDLFHEGWDQTYSGQFGDDIYSWMLGYTNP